jgi:hypothetical protein
MSSTAECLLSVFLGACRGCVVIMLFFENELEDN